MKEQGDNRGNVPPVRDDEKRAKLIRTVSVIIAAVFALAAVACVIAYVVLRLDILFIPIALCAVVAMISFTYSRTAG